MFSGPIASIAGISGYRQACDPQDHVRDHLLERDLGQRQGVLPFMITRIWAILNVLRGRRGRRAPPKGFLLAPGKGSGA